MCGKIVISLKCNLDYHLKLLQLPNQNEHLPKILSHVLYNTALMQYLALIWVAVVRHGRRIRGRVNIYYWRAMMLLLHT